MYCEKCGNQISDNAKFCRFCGAEVIPELSEISEYLRKTEEQQRIKEERLKRSQEISQEYEDEYEYDEDSEYENNRHYRPTNTAAAREGIDRAKATAGRYFEGIKDAAGKAAEKTREIRINKKILALVVAAAVVIAGVWVLVSLNKNTINLDKYLEISVTGDNGEGYAQSEIDWYKLEQECNNKIKTTEQYRQINSFYGNSETEWLSWYVYVNFDKQTELKNGDKINYSWEISDELYDYLDVKLKCKDGSITVSGLRELEEVDVFDHLSVRFSGNDGTGEVFFDCDEFLTNNGIWFSADKETSLSNGEEITVSFYSLDDVLTRGFRPISSEKTYVVEGLLPTVTETYSEQTDNYIYQESDSEEPLNDYVEHNIATDGFRGNPKSIYDIPDNIKSELREITEERIHNNVEQTWNYYEYLDKSEYIGQYLVSKTDVNEYGDNQVGVVFKNHVSIRKDGWTPHEFEYYYVLVFRNLCLLENGGYSFDNWFEPDNSVYVYPPSGGTYYYTGFNSEQDMYDFLVNPLIKKYEFTADYLGMCGE